MGDGGEAKESGNFAGCEKGKEIKTESGLQREIRWSPGDSRPALQEAANGAPRS